MLSSNRIVIRVVLIALFAVAGAANVWAGTVGTITGVVKDAGTGLPLSDANVTILGTTMGAAASATGEFFILNVPAGTYDVKASHLGYKEVVLHDVKVAPDFTTQVSLKLEQTTAAQLAPIVVGAEKPLIQKDKTATARFIEGKDIQNQPIQGYQDAASLQAGVVAEGGPLRGAGGAALEEATNAPRLYIRGGRSDETAYFVDGFSQQDPLTGISTTSIDQNAIQQVVVMTGGFDAEYGKIMSGAVNVITKGGSDKYFGSVEAVTDNLSGSWIGSKRYDYNTYSANLGGPIPGIEGLTFSASGQREWERDRSPKPINDIGLTADQQALYKDGQLPANYLSGYTWQGRVDYNVGSTAKIKLGTLGSKEYWQEFHQWTPTTVSSPPGPIPFRRASSMSCRPTGSAPSASGATASSWTISASTSSTGRPRPAAPATRSTAPTCRCSTTVRGRWMPTASRWAESTAASGTTTCSAPPPTWARAGTSPTSGSSTIRPRRGWSTGGTRCGASSPSSRPPIPRASTSTPTATAPSP